jgi:hypothetical protein
MNSNPFDNNTIQKREENGIYYYIVPEGLTLFKATKKYDIRRKGLKLDPTGSYFFGVKNMHPQYIKSYEQEYGIIFEFKTNREYKLLALDNKSTQKHIHEIATPEIQEILKTNYGYDENKDTLLRDSTSTNDIKLSRFLCENGYHGYAIHNMKTHLGGVFHDELMICKINGGVEYVGKITEDDRMYTILDNKKRDEIAQEMKNKRTQMKTMSLFDPNEKIKPKQLFAFDNDVDDVLENDENKVNRTLFFGGIKKRSSKKRTYKNKKAVKNTRKNRIKRKST